MSLTSEFHEKMISGSTDPAGGVQQRKNAARDMQRTGWIIDPRRTKAMQKWDLTMVACLAFTALVTPVEVAFLQEGKHVNGLWIINRIVDMCFIMDIIFCFHLAFQAKVEQGGHWVFNKRVIVLTYLRGWFTIDFVSVLPFWLITLDLEDPFGAKAQLASLAEGPNMSSIGRASVLIRIVKLLRMLKLARVLKASRVMQRVLLDLVMNNWECTYSFIKMVKLCSILTIWAHWQACIWGLLSSYMAPEVAPPPGTPPQNWISAFEESYRASHGAPPHPMDTYCAALYWSVQTLTSIGYGEMLPVNSAERILCSVYMMISGVLWTWVIGAVAATATTLDPAKIIYETTMDQLNYFMRERQLPRPMRMMLRDFFTSARQVHAVSDDADLLNKMSPLLQGTVALAANKRWLDRIWYFRNIDEVAGGSDFIATLAKTLSVYAYVSHERLPVGQLYILRKGFVVRMWRFLRTGSVWGEDMILDSTELMDHAQGVALTYVECYTLRRPDLEQVLKEFPQARERVRRAMRRMTLQRAMLKYLALENGKTVSSFAPRSQARGFTVVPAMLTVEQKIDLMKEQGDAVENDMKYVKDLVSPVSDGAKRPTPALPSSSGLRKPGSPSTLEPLARTPTPPPEGWEATVQEQAQRIDRLEGGILELREMMITILAAQNLPLPQKPVPRRSS